MSDPFLFGFKFACGALFAIAIHAVAVFVLYFIVGAIVEALRSRFTDYPSDG